MEEAVDGLAHPTRTPAAANLSARGMHRLHRTCALIVVYTITHVATTIEDLPTPEIPAEIATAIAAVAHPRLLDAALRPSTTIVMVSLAETPTTEVVRVPAPGLAHPIVVVVHQRIVIVAAHPQDARHHCSTTILSRLPAGRRKIFPSARSSYSTPQSVVLSSITCSPHFALVPLPPISSSSTPHFP